MKAMILAAGLGSRLGALGQHTPKCLLQAGDRTLLEHVVDRLKAAGVERVVINLHHLAEQVRSFVESRQGFGLHVTWSFEEVLLDTGGGLYRMRHEFRDEPCFFVHNADVYSDLDLRRLLAHHPGGAVATLAVMVRQTSRYLLFDDRDHLNGLRNLKAGREEHVAAGPFHPLGFSGIQVATPRLFRYMDGLGESFSLTVPYLKAAEAGETVQAYRMDDAYWMDVGTPERLQAINRRLAGTPGGIA